MAGRGKWLQAADVAVGEAPGFRVLFVVAAGRLIVLFVDVSPLLPSA